MPKTKPLSLTGSFSSETRRAMMEAERRRPPNRQKSGGRESDTPLSPPLADPREFYRVAGKIVSGKKFSENILPANAEPYQPSRLEGISLRLKEIFGR